MERGTYVAASGGLYGLKKLDVAAHNIANVNTPGFKRQLLVTTDQRFEDTLAATSAKNDPFAEPDHERTPGVVNSRTVTDFSPGPLSFTQNPLDVALRNPKDFFVVQGPQGNLYTRAGNFTLDAEGTLVTPDGMPVVGDGGAITATGAGVRISEDGRLFADGEPVAGLSVVRFEDPASLEQVGNSHFKVRDGAAAQPEPVEAEVIPRTLEMSNVSMITTVLDLITAQRGFQAYTKSAETIDSMNQTAMTRVGSPSR